MNDLRERIQKRLDAWRQVAEAAEQSHWPHSRALLRDVAPGWASRADFDHIVTFSPVTVLTLVAGMQVMLDGHEPLGDPDGSCAGCGTDDLGLGVPADQCYVVLGLAAACGVNTND